MPQIPPPPWLRHCNTVIIIIIVRNVGTLKKTVPVYYHAEHRCTKH